MFRRILGAIPGVAAAVLPNATCPACWPAYAGILSALGLGFLMKSGYFIIIISFLLAVSLFSLIYKAKKRRGYRPFLLGLLAVAVIILGKIVLNSDLLLYAGAALLIVASIWNNFPRKKRVNEAAGIEACPHCKPN